MIPLSISNKELKNSLFDSGVWLLLLTFTNIDNSVNIRVVNNVDNVVYDGNIFYPFPFKLDTISESNKGELPKVNITLSNVDRLVEAYIENDPDLGSGWAVHIDIIHSLALDNKAEVVYDFVTQGITANETEVTFSCTMPNPLRYQFPRIRILPNSCQHMFKKGGCIYNGHDISCAKTLSACEEKFPNAKTLPFLGFPGIPTNAVYTR